MGSISDTVTVEGASPLVNTVSAQQLQNYSVNEPGNCPSESQFHGTAAINAGVVPTQGNDGTGVNMNGVGRTARSTLSMERMPAVTRAVTIPALTRAVTSWT